MLEGYVIPLYIKEGLACRDVLPMLSSSGIFAVQKWRTVSKALRHLSSSFMMMSSVPSLVALNRVVS
jgi:hypothetical protein